MTVKYENAIKNRYEFVMLFDVENGNPNGDPDAGNMPRTDAETGLGIVTDVCIKRKIRNYIKLIKEGEKGYKILIDNDKALNEKFDEAYEKNNLSKEKKSINEAQEYICKEYYDVRTFGAVMSTGDNSCGTVRGPVQINFARSIDPVGAQELTITRQAVTTVEDREKKGNEMGKKNIVPYGLYRAEGYVSALLAQKVTGFSEDDLTALWEAIKNMFEHDHSAARGKMCLRKLFIFKHSSALGNSPSHILFEKIKVYKKEGVIVPRAFSDYNIDVDKDMPAGVEYDERSLM